MKFENVFELPLSPMSAWPLLLDVPRIVPCMPGAELTQIDGDGSYKGKVAVRLGPVALGFSGRAVIEEIDDQRHTARIKAQGADQKGRGGANAVISFRLEPSESSSKVIISTDLTLSGSVAQYGRGAGVIREVAAELTAEFARRLREQLAPSGQSLDADAMAPRPPASGAQSAAPISGLPLLFRALWATLRNAFRPTSDANPRGSDVS